MSTLTTPQLINGLDALLRLMTLQNRIVHFPVVAELIKATGGDPKDYEYFMRNVSHWPAAVNRASEEYRFAVDFDVGGNQDVNVYVATAAEICLLLKYTPASLKVSMSTGRGKIDRTQRGSRLGPCVVKKLDAPLNLADYPRALFLGEREAKLQQSGYKRFRGPTKPGMFKKRYD